MLLSIFIAMKSHAADSWIHVVGIDEAHPQQNYENFYRTASEFNTACKKSEMNRTCTLFINNDPSLARKYENPDEAPKNFVFENNAGQPTYALAKIKDSVLSGKPGDTIIISLVNHGAPWRSASCVWINSKEQICDADIKAILDQKPNGVKVVVSGDACFSGAFADLSSSEVCTMTAASRYEVGYVAGRGLWNAINERFPKTLSDLKEPIVAESGRQKLLGSQVILQSLCSEARKKFSPEEIVSQLKRNDSYNVFQTDQCRDADNSATALTKFSKQVLNLMSLESLQNCGNLKVPAFVCDSLQRLKNAEPNIREEIVRSMKVSSQQNGLNEMMLKKFAEQRTEINKLSQLLKTLPPQESLEITESIKLNIEPDWSKFNPEVRSELQLAYAPLRDVGGLSLKNKEVIKETDAIYTRLRNSGLYEDLMNVQNCFNENESSKTPHQSVWEESAKKFQPRKFTLKDYEDAKKCESSISF
jgi:hypothetical protein